MSVLVVGSVALDDVETPAGRADGVLGGAASYFSVAASFFEKVRAVGVVGDDFPAEHLEFLASRGIDVSGIAAERGKTFRWGGVYSESLNERETRFTDLGVFEAFAPKLAPEHRCSEFVFLANIHPTLQLQILEQVESPRFVAMDTMNFWIEGTPAELERVLARVDALLINDEEARQLSGEHNLARAAVALRARGPASVIIKRGESGCLLFGPDQVFSAPAYPLEVVRDPTGAGDCFAGGFLGALAREGDLGPEAFRRAVIYGSVVASFCCERFSLDGLRDLSIQAIESRFDAFRSLTRF
ncbi:MAG: sugar kinase [Myxococcales bacterium]|nr:sugar kinase [Myxococcales bacterium]